MGYAYELTLDAAAEIDAAIQHYELQFSSGASDFLTAFDDTIERVLRIPQSGRRRSEKDVNIRGHQLLAEPESKAYAKKFPYLLIYKVYEEEQKVVIFQLWPLTSGTFNRGEP